MVFNQYFVLQADDPDTTKRVTYVIKQGPDDLFKIHPNTGVIKTSEGLDYEMESQYTLIVGTLENNTTKPGATTKVIVSVQVCLIIRYFYNDCEVFPCTRFSFSIALFQDVNDIPPVFLNIPRPITLDNNVAIGTKVTTLMATDSDGTSPGNKVRYEIVGRGKAVKYFHIDPDLGMVSVRDDLSKEPDSEYQVIR